MGAGPLASAHGVVVGAADVDAMVAFFAALGFEQTDKGVLEAGPAGGLYGGDGERLTCTLAAPGSTDGTVRIVQTALSPAPHEPFGRGPSAFDVYCRDIDAAAAQLSGAGYQVGPVGEIVLGLLVMRQVLVLGPDGTRVVLIESDRRRSSVLDTDPSRAFSEGHSVVWSVDSVADSVAFWSQVGGLTAAFDAPVEHPDVARFLQLPRPGVRLRMAMVCDEQVRPLRLEFLCFVDDDPPAGQAAAAPGDLLGGGLRAISWRVADLAAAAARLTAGGARLGPVVQTRDALAAGGVAPDGVRFELWHRRDAG